MVEVKTIVSESLIHTFNMYQARKRLWFPIIAAAVLVLLGFIILPDPDIGVIGCIVLVVLGVAMPALYWVAVTVMAKRTVKNSPLLKSSMTQIFRFADKIVINESSKYVNANEMEYAWELLYKAVETPAAFYLYISKYQAFIVDRNGFTMGTPLDLHNLLAEKLDKKRFTFPKRFYAGK